MTEYNPSSFYILIGFTFQTPTGEGKCRAMLMLSPDDLPARALMTNMKNFKGESGCSTCEQKGETVEQWYITKYI